MAAVSEKESCWARQESCLSLKEQMCFDWACQREKKEGGEE